ncbi:MAG: ABC transporter permease subunit [Treponema sp.]|jgi:L-cystine transport system permease protein|nr:ABC transporter permease subunit [Treponema sp.]
MDFDFRFFFIGLRESIRHIPVSFCVTLAVLVIGVIFGFLVALTRCYRVKFLAEALRVVVTVLRGIPLILFLLIFKTIIAFTYDDLMAKLGLNLSYRDLNKALIAIAAMSIPMVVNISEMFRGAFAAVDKSQFDASRAIGHTGAQTLFRVALPQMIPVSIPMLGNIVIGAIKGTSLLLYVSVVDILNGSVLAAALNYKYLEAYFAAACVFWAICASMEWLFHFLEKKFKQTKAG